MADSMVVDTNGGDDDGDTKASPDMESKGPTSSATSCGVEDIYEVLKGLSKRWQDVGMKSGLPSSKVALLEGDYKDSSPEECLKLVVQEWVEGGDNQQHPVTWTEVVELLREMGEIDLANKTAEDKGVVMNGSGEGEGGGDEVPDYKTQKSEITAALQQRLKKGETWFLVDVRWIKQWKKYVGYDQWDQQLAGQESANPGPLDNSNLFKEGNSGPLKEHLMEELDYFLLPESAWSKLSSWYSINEGSSQIARKVVEHGLYMKHCKVEVYLLEFKLSLNSDQNVTVSKHFSRASTVAELELSLKQTFSISEDTECRVWHRYMTHTYELLNNSSQTLQDAGLYNGQTIVLEVKKEDGTWPRNSTQVTSSSQHPTRSSDSFGTSSGSSGSSYSSGYSSGGSNWSSYSKPSSPGLCGLSNLGNTCFMNSALQCLSNTSSLTEYFISTKAGYKPYKKHINKNNPLGMGGAIAEAYGALLEDMWSGKMNCVAPRQFKMQVSRYAPQFVGYAQHDSQELLAFLLDGLHEDLNLVKEKPYVDMSVETDDRTDKEIAEETWLKYMMRNQSVVVRLFQGQLKSTLVCPKCNKTSKTFDPFMFLSLPLPIKNTRKLLVHLVPLDPDKPIMKYKLKVLKRGHVINLKNELHKMSGVQVPQMTVVDVHNSRFHRIYTDKDSISLIMDRDVIYVYELSACQPSEEMIHVSIYHREEMVRDVRYTSSSYTQHYHQLFGVPMVITIPRQNCSYSSIYQAVMEKGRRYIKSWAQVKNEEVEEAMEVEDNNSQEEVKEEVKVEILTSSTAIIHNKNKNEVQKKEDESSSNSTKMEEEEDGESGNKGEDEEVEKGIAEGKEEEVFKMGVVNSYGSQEVQKLEHGVCYNFSRQTYIACDWSSKSKEMCYSQEIAEDVKQDSSCEAVEGVKKNIVLMDCLKLFAQTETLSKDDAWYCPKCEEFVQATKKFDLWRLPNVLVIHLKRFSYDRYWRDKLDALVEFPIKELDLSELVHSPDDTQPLYDLFAVSNHFGGMGGGHYTAYAKNKFTQKWYNFDDSHVAETTEDHLVSSSAYVLYYQRRMEGKPVNKMLDRSLSQSFAEEKKILSNKYNTPPDTVEEGMSHEEEEEEEELTGQEEEVFDNNLEQPD